MRFRDPLQILMGILPAVLLSAGSAAWPQQAALQDCQRASVEDARVANRSMRLSLRQGAQVILVGHQHGARQNLDWLVDFVNDPGFYSDQAVRMVIARILGDLQSETLQHMKSNYDFLVDFLRSHADFNVVADECTEAVCKITVERIRFFVDSLDKEFRRRGLVLTHAQFNDLIQGVIGTVGPYFAIQNPLAGRKFDLNGFEDINAILAFEQVALRRREAEDRLRGALGSGYAPGWLGEALAPWAELVEADGKGLVTESFAQGLRLRTHLSTPELYRPQVLQFFDSTVDYIQSSYERDAAMAKNILALQKNLILFVGEAHLEPLSQALLHGCRGAAN